MATLRKKRGRPITRKRRVHRNNRNGRRKVKSSRRSQKIRKYYGGSTDSITMPGSLQETTTKKTVANQFGEHAKKAAGMIRDAITNWFNKRNQNPGNGDNMSKSISLTKSKQPLQQQQYKPVMPQYKPQQPLQQQQYKPVMPQYKPQQPLQHVNQSKLILPTQTESQPKSPSMFGGKRSKRNSRKLSKRKNNKSLKKKRR